MDFISNSRAPSYTPILHENKTLKDFNSSLLEMTSLTISKVSR